MKNLGKLSFLLLLLAGIMWSCAKEEELIPEEPEAPLLTQKINTFIQYVMEEYYLWNEDLPDIDIKYEFDSKVYFEKLLNEEDIWSFISDDIQSFINSLQGVETSYGYSLSFGKRDDESIVGVVEYVHPNTPASEAGIERGDFIHLLNGAAMTLDNYTDLLYSSTMSITYGSYSDGVVFNDTTIQLTARELNLDPVLIKKVIEHEGHKIGYLFYTQFIDNYFDSMDNALTYFRDNGVTELVIDLRYNPGGYGFVAQYLCSSLAPLSVVNSEEILITKHYNESIQNMYAKNNELDQLQTNFQSSVPVKMGFDKLHVLTTYGTASASELFIVGLDPYMDITTVGEATYGKYAASWTLKPEYVFENSSDYEDFKEWGIQPIVLRYANSQGVTDFKDGITPDISAEDWPVNRIPLGQKDEPLLKAAIEDITGAPVVAMKKAQIKADFTAFDRGFSRFDKNKRDMVIEDIENILPSK